MGVNRGFLLLLGAVLMLALSSTASSQTDSNSAQGNVDADFGLGGGIGPKSPCDDPARSWDSELLAKAIDYAGGKLKWKNEVTKQALMKLYSQRLKIGNSGQYLRLSPLQIKIVSENAGDIYTLIEGIHKLGSGEPAEAVAIFAKYRFEKLLDKKLGIPFVEEILTTMEIVHISMEEVKIQEALFDYDMGFYRFLDDEKVQALLADPSKAHEAQEYYIRNYLLQANPSEHRQGFQGWLELKRQKDNWYDRFWRYLNVADWIYSDNAVVDRFCQLRTGLRLREDETYREQVMKYLQSLEARREVVARAEEKTRLRVEAKKHLDETDWQLVLLSTKAMKDHPQLPKLICEEYERLLEAQFKAAQP